MLSDSKTTIRHRFNVLLRSKIAAWLVIAACFGIVIVGGFVLGWRNVFNGVVFAAAATLFGGLLLKYLDWQTKEHKRARYSYGLMIVLLYNNK